MIISASQRNRFVCMDPYEAYDVLVQKGYAAAQTAEQAQGELDGDAWRRRHTW
jgi:hypothetical protein